MHFPSYFENRTISNHISSWVAISTHNVHHREPPVEHLLPLAQKRRNCWGPWTKQCFFRFDTGSITESSNSSSFWISAEERMIICFQSEHISIYIIFENYCLFNTRLMKSHYREEKKYVEESYLSLWSCCTKNLWHWLIKIEWRNTNHEKYFDRDIKYDFPFDNVMFSNIISEGDQKCHSRKNKKYPFISIFWQWNNDIIISELRDIHRWQIIVSERYVRDKVS